MTGTCILPRPACEHLQRRSHRTYKRHDARRRRRRGRLAVPRQAHRGGGRAAAAALTIPVTRAGAGGAGGWQFRGKRIAAAAARRLLGELGLDAGGEVLLTGDSAGGVGCLHNADWLHAMLQCAAPRPEPRPRRPRLSRQQNALRAGATPALCQCCMCPCVQGGSWLAFVRYDQVYLQSASTCFCLRCAGRACRA